MGFSLHFISDIGFFNVYAQTKKPEPNCEESLPDRFYWLLDEHVWSQEESILYQMEAITGIPIVWMGEIFHSDNMEDENGKEDKKMIEAQFKDVDSSLEKLHDIVIWLRKKIPIRDKLTFSPGTSEANQKHYPDYIENGKFLEDLEMFINLLKCYKQFGCQQFLMCWG